ncbi:MAG: cytochrome c [Bdellovibrionaceae bacterium]|nr:cytochrome c [Pseudobdellovibrionaceae bacterium]
MKRQMILLTLSISALGLFTACTGGSRPTLHSEPNVELVQDMMDQKAIKAQDYDHVTGEAGSRLPPAGTVPQGYKPYAFKGNPAGGATLKNPFTGDLSPEVLALGQKKYETYCLVCHGVTGAGDGPVAAKMALKPPPVTSDKIIGVSDGAIYHIITDGQGVMSSYAYQMVDEKDRWALVNYIRSLQKLKRGQ